MADAITTPAPLLEAMTGPGLRSYRAPDDAMETIVRLNDFAIVDTYDLHPSEGYWLVDLGPVAQIYRVQNDMVGGYRMLRDSPHHIPFTIPRLKFQAMVPGRVVGAVRRVA